MKNTFKKVASLTAVALMSLVWQQVVRKLKHKATVFMTAQLVKMSVTATMQLRRLDVKLKIMQTHIHLKMWLNQAKSKYRKAKDKVKKVS